MKSLFRLADRLYNAPLAITYSKAEVIEAVFRAHVNGTPDVEAAATVAAQQAAEEAFRSAELLHYAAASGVKITRADGGYLLADNGIAIVPVMGTLVQRTGGLDALSGMMSYSRIGAMVASALDDPQARGILLEIDSPGGEVAGCFDLCAKIIAAGKVKPIQAIANEAAFSAAYAIAASAGKLFMPQTGMVGSVGVIAMHVDQSKRDAAQGYVYTPIFAGAKKNDFSSHAPLSERARNEAQDDVDRAYSIFVEHVAAGRGIPTKAVRATEAGILNFEQAKAIGFADGEASFSEALQTFGAAVAPHTGPTYHFAAQAAPTKQGDSAMNPQDTNTPAGATNAPAPAAAVPTVDALAAAHARGVSEGEAKGAKTGAAAERTRIAAILQSAEAADRFELAAHFAFESDMTPETVAKALSKAPKAAASAPRNLFANMMNANENPDVGATANGDGDAATPEQIAAKVVSLHNRLRGQASK